MSDCKLFIGNICTVTAESLRVYCETYGRIIDLSINRDKDNNVYHCFAFVTYQSPCSVKTFMSTRPHILNNQEIFVKRALPRSTASIPERLVVTNRLVILNPNRFNKRKLGKYFQKLGYIKMFDYEKGFIDFDDYDDVDCILLDRPHSIDGIEIVVTKFVPQDFNDIELMHNPKIEILRNNNDSDNEDYKLKYKYLEQQFEEYKKLKEKEINCLHKELDNLKEQLSDVTQIKLDKLIRNQNLFHNQLLLSLCPNSDTLHSQMCEDFLRTNINKKRKAPM